MKKSYINYSTDEIVNKYFKELKKTKLLTPDEEVDLSISIKLGDKSAMDKLVKSNLKFVVSVARDYQGQGLSISDLINEGNLGLIKAAKRYDHTRGFRFISYAVWWVRQSIMQSLNNNSRTIRYPTNVINKISNSKKEFEKFELLNERTADYMDFNDNDDIIDYKVLAKSYSFNEMVNDEGSEISDFLSEDYDEDVLFGDKKELIKNELNSIISDLNVRESEIIKSYFGVDKDYESMTLEAIGEKYGLTKERVRQIKEKALRKLRHNSKDLFDIINN